MGHGIFAKLVLSFGALLLGPVFVIVSDPLVRWPITGGLIGVAFISGSALISVWRKPEKKPSKIAIFIGRCWHGEEALWKVFWLVGFGLVLATAILSYAGTALRAPLIWWFIVLALGTVVQLWWAVSVWRCAKNTYNRMWTVLSRAIVAISLIGFAYRMASIVAYFAFGI